MMTDGSTRRVRIRRPGGYDRLEIERGYDPGRPGAGEVLVEVRAAGVNYADSAVRMGLYASAKEYVGWPITPGFEFAGRVLEIGSDVDGGPDGGAGAPALKPGDAVLGVTRFGGWSSHVVTRAALVRRLPAGLSMEQAAGIPTVFLTAWYPLHGLGRVRAGETMLVHSAAGGVGGALVQLGRIAGCRVIGVVGAPHKADLVRELGADVVIDKSSEDLWATVERHAPRGCDVVLDANGVATLRGSYDHLAPGGRLVVYGFHTMLPRGRGRPSWPRLAVGWLRTPRFDPLRLVNENRSVLAFNLSYLFDQTALFGEAIDALLGWLADGRIRPLPTTPYPVERVAEAQRAIESARTTGKLVLTF